MSINYQSCTPAELRLANKLRVFEFSAEVVKEIISNPNTDVFSTLLDLRPREMRAPVGWHVVVKKAVDAKFLCKVLQLGVDIDARFDRYTALEIAIDAHKPSFCELLLEAGANVNLSILGEEGYPIYRAIERGCDQVVEVLLRWGANINNPFTAIELWAGESELPNSRVLPVIFPHLRFADSNDNHLEYEDWDSLFRHAISNTGSHWPIFDLLNQFADSGIVVSGASPTKNGDRLVIEYSAWIEALEQSCIWQIVSILYMSGMVCTAAEKQLFSGLTAPRWIVTHGAVSNPLFQSLMAGILPPLQPDSSAQLFRVHRTCNTLIYALSDRIATICIALQQLRLPTLVLVELIQAVYSHWPNIRFCDIWNRVVLVRHFHDKRAQQ